MNDLSTEDGEQMYGELQSPYQMCPNVTSFQVKNGYFSDTNLKL